MAITPFSGYCSLLRSVIGFSITEITGPNYARQPISFSLVNNAGNQLYNVGAVNFTNGAGSDWGNVAYFGFWDSLTLGNLIFYTPQTFQPGNFAFYVSANEHILLPPAFFTWDFYEPVQRPWWPFGTTMGVSANVTGAVPVVTGSPVVNIAGNFAEANVPSTNYYSGAFLGAMATSQRPISASPGAWYYDTTLGRPVLMGNTGWENFAGGPS